MIAILARRFYGLMAHADYEYVDGEVIQEFVIQLLHVPAVATVERAADYVYVRRLRRLVPLVEQHVQLVQRKISSRRAEDKDILLALSFQLQDMVRYINRRFRLPDKVRLEQLLPYYETLADRHKLPYWLIGRLHTMYLRYARVRVTVMGDAPVLHHMWHAYCRKFEAFYSDGTRPWGHDHCSRIAPTFCVYARRGPPMHILLRKDNDIAIAVHRLLGDPLVCPFCYRKHPLTRCGRWWRQRSFDDFIAYAPLRKLGLERPPAGKAKQAHWDAACEIEDHAQVGGLFERHYRLHQRREELAEEFRIEYWFNMRLDMTEEEYVAMKLLEALEGDISEQED